MRVGRVLNKYKVGKHFKRDIRDDSFSFEIDDTKVTAEAALDGIYVIRTSLAEQRMKTDDTVRSYKLLTQVERAFRSFKSMDLKVRPIRHRRENRVRAHVFLCMLAYYVLWHMMEAWRPLLFSDEDQQAKARRDPVAPAKRSEAALRKIQTKKLDDGSRASSFRTLLPSQQHRPKQMSATGSRHRRAHLRCHDNSGLETAESLRPAQRYHRVDRSQHH